MLLLLLLLLSHFSRVQLCATPGGAAAHQAPPSLGFSRQEHWSGKKKKNIGVGCHFLLQCMNVKSEREFAQSCPTLRYPMDCSPPGSSVHSHPKYPDEIWPEMPCWPGCFRVFSVWHFFPFLFDFFPNRILHPGESFYPLKLVIWLVFKYTGSSSVQPIWRLQCWRLSRLEHEIKGGLGAVPTLRSQQDLTVHQSVHPRRRKNGCMPVHSWGRQWKQMVSARASRPFLPRQNCRARVRGYCVCSWERGSSNLLSGQALHPQKEEGGVCTWICLFVCFNTQLKRES